MGKMKLDDLKKLREEKRKELSRRDPDKRKEIVIGMGTCGIAAGAKETFDAFLDECDKQGVTDIVMKQTGCMGLCHSEPTVEIKMQGIPDIVYGKVDPEVARKIVRKHLIDKALVNDHIYDKPAADIMGEETEGKE
ncbi:MAG: (2Fe-2S) ferredoxin domain-containing protein [Chitinivibrionales bacterium]|nr:(2Fe-2S) ferredoxin domain-containing protein [Chitinivibrionales bacterium]MBD3356568.1 (2Fe-2S) ferredoxin domain-containing protein [Chitinivibrionales bacterium]